MKHLNPFIVFLLFTIAVFFVGCSDDENEETTPIVVDNQTSLNQNVFADKTEGSGVSFTTAAAWTSSIKSATSVREVLKETPESPDWISLSPSSGDKAGNYTVMINLEKNITGSDRSATIIINCEGSEIKINVTQKGTKEDGAVLARKITFEVYSCNDQWSPENNIPYIAAENAEIRIYKDSASVGIHNTDKDGKAQVYLEDGEYTYTVARDKEKDMTDNGYLIAGIFTSEEGPKPFPEARLGGLKYVDMDGDGVITEQDKRGGRVLVVSEDDEVEVYIASSDFVPTYKPFYYGEVKSSMDKAYRNMVKEAYMIDAAMTREVSLPSPYNLFANFSFDENSTPISSLWNEAYSVIRSANLIHENIEKVSEISEEDRNYCKADASYNRMYAYSVLLNYFGGVPVYDSSTFENVPRNSVQEVIDFIFSNEYMVSEFGSISLKHSALQIMSRIAINNGYFDQAINFCRQIIDSGNYRLVPKFSWGDDAISLPVSLGIPSSMWKGQAFSLPVRYAETMLLNAEASLEHGILMEAIETVNIFALLEGKEPVFPNGGASTEEVREAVAFLWKDVLNKEGHTFAQLKRTGTFISTLGSYGATDKHLLLPIPATAFENPNMTQNPGW